MVTGILEVKQRTCVTTESEEEDIVGNSIGTLNLGPRMWNPPVWKLLNQRSPKYQLRAFSVANGMMKVT